MAISLTGGGMDMSLPDSAFQSLYPNGVPLPLFSVVLNSFILLGLWIMACNSFVRLD